MNKDKYSDQDIIQGIVHQNKEVLKFVYQNNYRSVKKYIEFNNGSEKDAEDVFQDSLIVIYEKIRNNEFTLTSSFNTFLFSIAKFRWLSLLKQKQTHNLSYENCDNYLNNDPTIHDEFITAERKKIFVQHFNDISEECKKIIQHVINDCSLEEITKLMAYNSVQYTKNRKLKCKKFLITSIMSNPRFNELTNEKIGKNNQIPRQ